MRKSYSDCVMLGLGESGLYVILHIHISNGGWRALVTYGVGGGREREMSEGL